MQRYRLREDSETYKNIEKLESLMDDLGLQVEGSHLRLVVKKKNGSQHQVFCIGRDSTSFPRCVEENFWKYGDE